jgi:serine/threonine protein kinase
LRLRGGGLCRLSIDYTKLQRINRTTTDRTTVYDRFMQTDQTTSRGSKPLPIGYQLRDYTMVSVLGDGGFGITYRARDTKLGVDVAIKEYFPSVYATRTDTATIVPTDGADLDNYRWGLNAFLSEAQALAKFKHPQIVRVLRFLEANGTAYTIMEYEEGETLTAYLRRHGGVLSEPRLLQIFLPILNGLHAVHDAGLLHLDIKPDNIYMRRNEQPMLIDFGSSRQMVDDSAGQIALTPGFCALEQYPGHGTIGVASDVYGMGATLYRCVTSKNPMDALARHQVFERLNNDPLPPATSFERPLYAAHIRESIDRALKLAIEERPASAFALQQSLMGKDLAKIAARPTPSLYRPGTGFLGVLSAPEKPKKFRRRYSFFEKLIAVSVFIATFAVITPKFLIDTGRLSESGLFRWIDDTKSETIAQATQFRDRINERLFGVEPRSKVATPAPKPRLELPAPVEPVAAPARKPFGTDMQRAPDIALPEAAPRALGFLKHGAILAVVTTDGFLHLWDVATGEARTTLSTHVSNAAALGVFPSSRWVAVQDREQAIAVFDPIGNREYVLRNDPPHEVSAIAVSANGLQLAELAKDHRIAVWELSQQRRQLSWDIAKSTVPLLAFSPDARVLLTGDTKGNITAWNSTDGRRLTQWRAHGRTITAFALSADGRRLASADAGGEVRLWKGDGDAWVLEHVLANSPASVNSVAFSPDNEWLIAVGAGGNAYVWDVAKGSLEHQLTTDRRRLRALALSNDGKALAVASDDNLVRVWK